MLCNSNALPTVTLIHSLPVYLARKLICFAVLQDIWPYDGRSDALLGDLHALLNGRDTTELSAVRVPFCEFWGADDADGAVYELLEVCPDSVSHSRKGLSA